MRWHGFGGFTGRRSARGDGVAHLASVRPRLTGPRFLFDDRDKVDELSRPDEVVHEVPARPHPHLSGHLEREFAQPLLGNQAR
jgi:hypothetical protein